MNPDSTVLTELRNKPRVLLVGSPNCGKTTLFNWLTGLRGKIVNYPGSTVEHARGEALVNYEWPAEIWDTPGLYSLSPKSPEEEITLRCLFEQDASHIVFVLDATQLPRQLVLLRQLQSCGLRVIVAMTMADLVEDHATSWNLKLMKKELDLVEVVLIEGRLGGGVKDLVKALAASPVHSQKAVIRTWDNEWLESTHRNMTSFARQVSHQNSRDIAKGPREFTRKMDRWLLHPIFGFVTFVVLMAALFTSIFWIAQPAMDFVDLCFSSLATFLLSFAPESSVMQFLSGGVIAGVGSVMMFVPQIAILFLGLSMLEDSGYLARASSLIDRPLALLGLNGKSFVPLLSAHACAIPALMSARTIANPRERYLTMFIIPLMTCSARLPVYALLLAFLFIHQPAWHAGLALTAIYFSSAVIGGLASLILHRMLPQDIQSLFVMELPLYRKPQWRALARNVMQRTLSYVKRAGPMILMLSVLIWVMTHFPNLHAEATERLTTSWAGVFGRAIEPVMKPMGLDWRVGLALLAAFAAREVFVATMAVIFHVVGQEDSIREGLLGAMANATTGAGTPLFYGRFGHGPHRLLYDCAAMHVDGCRRQSRIGEPKICADSVGRFQLGGVHPSRRCRQRSTGDRNCVNAWLSSIPPRAFHFRACTS